MKKSRLKLQGQFLSAEIVFKGLTGTKTKKDIAPI